ncbi:MAG: ABC transporter permease [bacterium]|jgi:ABC-type uncharacterized transport system permease subunit
MKRVLTILALIISATALIAVAVASTGTPPGYAFIIFVQGAFGDKAQWMQTLSLTIPLLLTGLSVAVALRAGLFNIGAEGQLLVGGLMGAWTGYAFVLPYGLHLGLVLIVGALAGAIWALPAGLIKAWRGGHEVITTIMLNYLALNLVNYLLNGPMRAVSAFNEPKTPELMRSAWMPMLSFTDNSLSLGILVGIFVAIGLWVWLFRTPNGYETRAVGANSNAAKAHGISISRTLIMTMALSGALAGLAGAVLVAGVPEHRFYRDFSPGYGFDGIAVGLLAGANPLGVIPAAVVFGAVDSGTRYMESLTSVPRDIAVVVRGLIILGVAGLTWQRKKGSAK